MKQSRPRNAAFTLAELLVVIGIIALLISILLPSLNKAREQANKVACASNMRQIGLAVHMYANDFKQIIPPFLYPSGSTMRLNTSFGTYIAGQQIGLLVPRPVGYGAQAYLQTADVAFCPSDTVFLPVRTLTQNRPAWAPFPGYSNSALYSGYNYAFVTEEGADSGGINPSTGVGYYSGMDHRWKLGRSNSQAVILWDNGDLRDLTPFGLGAGEAFPHEKGWNALHLDGHVNFAQRDGIARQHAVGISLTGSSDYYWNLLYLLDRSD